MTFESRTWDWRNNVAGLILLMGNQPWPLNTWIFNDNKYINKR